MHKNICVFCSSSDAVHASYFAAAKELGEMIAKRGCALIYGGARVGLMGELARAVKAGGGKVVGIIPKAMKAVAYEAIDELHMAKDMRERKGMMEERSDAYVVMPGGFGTLEEAFEALTLKQLGYHAKPFVFLNTNDFYAPVNAVFEHLYQDHFAKPDFRKLYHFAPDAQDVFRYLDAYKPIHFQSKWYQAD